MPRVNIGSPSLTAYSSESPFTVKGIGLPQGRAMANGSQSVLISALSAYVAGRNGTEPVTLQLGSAVTSTFNVGRDASPGSTGDKATNLWLVNGGVADFKVSMSDFVNIMRGGAGTTRDGSGYTWDGSMAGSYYYVQAPTEPLRVSGTASTTTQGNVTLSWDAPDDDGDTGITGYNVYSTDGNKLLGSTTSRSITVGGQPGGETVGFYVRAKNVVTDRAGSQGRSSSIAYVAIPGLPSVPRNLTVRVNYTVENALNLDWDAPTSYPTGLVGYEITATGNGTTRTIKTGTSSSYTLTNLRAGIMYTIKVAARTNYSESIGSRGPAASILGMTYELPNAPIGLVSTPGGSLGELALNWYAPQYLGSSDFIEYEILRNGSVVAKSPVGYYLFRGLTPTSNYTHTVRAVTDYTSKSAMNGPQSVASTGMAAGPPSAPLNLKGTASSTTSGVIDLKWDLPSNTAGGVLGYAVYVDGALLNKTTSSRTMTITGFTPGRVVSFQVIAYNGPGVTTSVDGSPKSNTVTVEAPGPSIATTVLTASVDPLVAGTVTLNWSAPTSGPTPVRYDIYTSGLNGKKIGTTNASTRTFTATGLAPGVALGFYVIPVSQFTIDSGVTPGQGKIAVATPTGVLGVPTNIRYTSYPVVSSSAMFFWDAPPGEVLGYDVYIKYRSTGVSYKRFTPDMYFYVSIDGGGVVEFSVATRNVLTDASGGTGEFSTPLIVEMSPSQTLMSPGAGSINYSSMSVIPAELTILGSTANSFYGEAAASVSESYTRSISPSAAARDTTNYLINTSATSISGTPSLNTITATVSASVGSSPGRVSVGTNATSPVSLIDSTNVPLVGTYTVSGSVSLAPDYYIEVPKPGAAISRRLSGGSLKNLSNAVYNKVNVPITAVTLDTFSFALTGSYVATAASGTVTNLSNKNYYNGVRTVLEVPGPNRIKYRGTGTVPAAQNVPILFPYGDLFRIASTSKLTVDYRPGWLG